MQAVDFPDGRRIEYAYDACGQRREKRESGRLVEAYRWLAPLRLLEFHDGGEWWRLVYDPERASRAPVGVTNGIDLFLIYSDHLGTPLALANLDGGIVQTMQYDAFGNLLATRGDAVRLPLGFAGGLFDADTGLTRFVWRDYDADTGRFTALDPLGAKGGDSDWYGYCVDDPVNRVDAWGLEGEETETMEQGKRVLKSGQRGASIGGTLGSFAGSAFGVSLPGRIAGTLIGSGLGMGTQAVIEYPPVRKKVDEIEAKVGEWREDVWNSIPPDVRDTMERTRSLEDYSTE